MSYQMTINTDEVMDWVNRQPYREFAKRAAMTVTKNATQKKVKSLVKKHSVSGELDRSIVGRANGNGFKIWSALYGDIVLEYGRAPGPRPPIDKLQQWAKMKLNASEEDSYLIALKLSEKIATQGTKKYREGGPEELTWIQSWLNREFLPKQLDKLADEYSK